MQTSFAKGRCSALVSLELSSTDSTTIIAKFVLYNCEIPDTASGAGYSAHLCRSHYY